MTTKRDAEGSDVEADNFRGGVWFGAYALLGAVAAGLVPLLLPLWTSRGGTAAHVGLVMAALSLGQLSAPLWGRLADARRWHHLLFATGLLLAGLSLVGVVLSENPWALSALSFSLGLGVSATVTTANLFIVERYPQESWGPRLGLLGTFYGLGQVVGLVVAGLLNAVDLTLALGITAALPFVALGFTPSLPPMPGAPPAARPTLSHLHLRVEPLFASLGHAYHLIHLGKALRQLERAPPAFVRFLLLWFVITMGSSFIFAFYPLLMASQYGLSPSVAAWGYAAAAGLGLLLYEPAGRWASSYGGNRVLSVGILIRVGTLSGLALLGFVPSAAPGWVALTLFAVMVLAWSLLSVAGSALAANAGLPEGEAMGLFSANGALAGVSGALSGGVLVHAFGYGALPLAATCLMVLGAWLSLNLSD